MAKLPAWFQDQRGKMPRCWFLSDLADAWVYLKVMWVEFTAGIIEYKPLFMLVWVLKQSRMLFISLFGKYLD